MAKDRQINPQGTMRVIACPVWRQDRSPAASKHLKAKFRIQRGRQGRAQAERYGEGRAQGVRQSAHMCAGRSRRRCCHCRIIFQIALSLNPYTHLNQLEIRTKTGRVIGTIRVTPPAASRPKQQRSPFPTASMPRPPPPLPPPLPPAAGRDPSQEACGRQRSCQPSRHGRRGRR